MSDARRARPERRAALTFRVAQTAPVGGRPRRSPSLAEHKDLAGEKDLPQGSIVVDD